MYRLIAAMVCLALSLPGICLGQEWTVPLPGMPVEGPGLEEPVPVIQRPCPALPSVCAPEPAKDCQPGLFRRMLDRCKLPCFGGGQGIDLLHRPCSLPVKGCSGAELFHRPLPHLPGGCGPELFHRPLPPRRGGCGPEILHRPVRCCLPPGGGVQIYHRPLERKCVSVEAACPTCRPGQETSRGWLRNLNPLRWLKKDSTPCVPCAEQGCVTEVISGPVLPAFAPGVSPGR